MTYAAVIQLNNHIQASLENLDGHVDTVDTLHEVKEIVEESRDQGGLNPTAARLLELNLNSADKALGWEDAPSVEVSTESLSLVKNRYRHAEASLENVKSRIQTVIENLIKAFNKAFEFLKQLYQRIKQYLGAQKAKFKQTITKLKNKVRFNKSSIPNRILLEVSTQENGTVKPFTIEGLITELEKSITVFNEVVGVLSAVLKDADVLSSGDDLRVVKAIGNAKKVMRSVYGKVALSSTPTTFILNYLGGNSLKIEMDEERKHYTVGAVFAPKAVNQANVRDFTKNSVDNLQRTLDKHFLEMSDVTRMAEQADNTLKVSNNKDIAYDDVGELVRLMILASRVVSLVCEMTLRNNRAAHNFLEALASAPEDATTKA